MIRTTALAVAAAAMLVVTGCGNTDSDPKPQTAPVTPAPASTSTAAAAKAPTETGVNSVNGLEVSIQSVEDANIWSGPATLITYQVSNISSEMFQGYNWSAPKVVYGEAGTAAEHVISDVSPGVTGTLPPGSRQLAKHYYRVNRAQLNPAVITAGSIVWRGDFTTFAR